MKCATEICRVFEIKQSVSGLLGSRGPTSDVLQVNFRYFNGAFRDNDKDNEFVYDRLPLLGTRGHYPSIVFPARALNYPEFHYTQNIYQSSHCLKRDDRLLR